MGSAAKLLDLTQASFKPDEAKGAIAICEAFMPSTVIQLVHDGGFNHVVQKDGLAFDLELQAAKTMVEAPRTFLAHPCDVILGPRSASGRIRFEKIVQAGEKKTQTLTDFGGFVAGLGGSRRIWDQALLAADELYTNSSKNGWDPGVSLFEGEATRPGTIEFFAESDGKRLVIGSRDTYGSLDVRTVVVRILTCYQNGIADSIRRGKAGAGIGSYMVFESCVSYYAAVEADRSTVVAIVLPLGMGIKQMALLSKNIHLLSVPSANDGVK